MLFCLLIFFTNLGYNLKKNSIKINKYGNRVTKRIIGRFVLFLMGGFSRPNCLKFGH